MVKDIRIYFEGDSRLKVGFDRFFSEVIAAARRQRRQVSMIATNGTPARDFRIAQKKHPDSINILVLDSDRPLDGTESRRRGLASWDDRVFWMAEVMESWFLADREALKRYYARDFQESALPRNPQVEKISKADVLDGLKEATKNTQKREYHKTKHAPAILQMIDRNLVKEKAPQCKRLFDALDEWLAIRE